MNIYSGISQTSKKQLNQQTETNQFYKILDFIDGTRFDHLLENITNYLFKLILFIGIPYLIYIIFQLVSGA